MGVSGKLAIWSVFLLSGPSCPSCRVRRAREKEDERETDTASAGRLVYLLGFVQRRKSGKRRVPQFVRTTPSSPLSTDYHRHISSHLISSQLIHRVAPLSSLLAVRPSVRPSILALAQSLLSHHLAVREQRNEADRDDEDDAEDDDDADVVVRPVALGELVEGLVPGY